MTYPFRFIPIAVVLFSFSLLLVTCKSPTGKASHDDHAYTNKLVNESSPYLLQHAHNPVNWYPWGEEALAKAKAEDKLLVISVGYAACHWCHVMEHESFEDTLVSRVMNENFVSIKVDREERPDVDNVYMTACDVTSGQSCGWPLNAIALPDGRPVWAGTYFPKDKWIEVLEFFTKSKKEEAEKLEEYATQLTENLDANDRVPLNVSKPEFQLPVLNSISQNFLNNIDFREGGRQGAPKFPMPNNYEFLLKYHHLSKDPQALEAVTTTLDKMAFGGIYDHLGGGFARYSVDGLWKVPHFEKMLYDNGQLVSLYSKAFQVTKNPLYRQVVEQTLDFVAREMTSKEGGFYSSFDADSEGEEGKFYVWTKEEIETALKDAELSKIFNDYYEVKAGGNWEHSNILYRKQSDEKVAKKHKISVEELNTKLAAAKATLFELRTKRVYPGLDDKVLTAWNALMLKGYVDAYKAFDNKKYLDAALKNGQFLSKNMIQSDNRLNRNYKDGKSVINAFLDDYALLAEAFMALYEVTFDETWLNQAKGLVEYAESNFFDAESGMFFYTSKLDPALVARKKEVADNVIPGSNSAIARTLYKIGLYFYDTDKLTKSKQMMHNMSELVGEAEQPNFYSNWCSHYLDLVSPPYEVAVIGDNFQEKSSQLMGNYIPNAIFLGGKTEGSLELLKDKLQEGETMIYVCQNKVCKMPVTEVTEALTLID